MAYPNDPGNNPSFANTQKDGVGQIANGTGAGVLGADTNGVAIYTAGANGGRVDSFLLFTTDTTARDVFIYSLDGATVIPLGQVHITASAGNLASVLPVDALNPANMPGMPIDNDGKPYISLKAGAILKFSAVVVPTAGKFIYGSAASAADVL